LGIEGRGLAEEMGRGEVAGEVEWVKKVGWERRLRILVLYLHKIDDGDHSLILCSFDIVLKLNEYTVTLDAALRSSCQIGQY
jgi:hypothetical protein